MILFQSPQTQNSVSTDNRAQSRGVRPAVGSEPHSRGTIITNAQEQLREGRSRARSHWGYFEVPRVNGARNTVHHG